MTQDAVMNRALAAALRSYRFSGMVDVTIDRELETRASSVTIREDHQGGFNLWRAGLVTQYPTDVFTGRAWYHPPVVDDSGSAQPLFYLGFADGEDDRAPDIPDDGPGCTLSLRGALLQRAWLGVDVPITVVINIHDYHARVSMHRGSEWVVLVRSVPVVNHLGRVTFWAWLERAAVTVARMVGWPKEPR